MDIIYGGEIKNSTDIEFRYTDPKKLKEVEKFFIEFYLSNRVNTEIFYENNHELKYFNYNIISIIEEVVSGYRGLGFETIMAKINTKLREIYMSNPEGERFKYYEGEESDNESAGVQKRNVMNNSDINNLNTNFLNIKKEFIIREVFRDNDNIRIENGLTKGNQTHTDNTLYLSKLSDDPNNDHSLQFSNKMSNISFLNDDTMNMLSYNAGYGGYDEMALRGYDDLSPIVRTRNVAPVNISNRMDLMKEASKILDPLVKLQQSLNQEERVRSFSNDKKTKYRKKNSMNNNSLKNYLNSINNTTNSPLVQAQHRHNSFLVNQFYVKLSHNISRDKISHFTRQRTSDYQDIDLAYKKISNNKLSNIYYNIANCDADNKEAIPGFVLTGTEDKKDGVNYNNHSFAPKSTFRKNEEI
jgi:hypothetical protein